MVDINLLGDDKTGTGTGETDDTDRVEDFTQTSSMDTQELAFEERTETFDTTKTAGFAHRRSYSSLISTMIILAVIVLLGWGIYFFMFRDKGGPAVTQLAQFPDETEDFAEDLPAEPDQTTETTDFPATMESDPEIDAALQQQDTQQQPAESRQEPIQQQPQPRTSQPQRPVRTTPTLDLTPVASQFLANSKNAIEGVTNVLSAVPGNLNVTLLSYTARKARIEVVGNSSGEARGFASTLSQNFGGDFSIVSDNPVASNGSTKDKVLITGIINSGSAVSADGAQFLSLSQAQNWFRQTIQQYGLQLRELQTQSGSYVTDYQRTPILLRAYGSQSAIINFLEEINVQGINVELTKILLVSPDMVSHSDANLVLVINMFLYEPA